MCAPFATLSVQSLNVPRYSFYSRAVTLTCFIVILRGPRLHRATLIIAKLDRLARNVHVISSLMESGVEFIAVDFPQANRLTVHILAAVAEHEASMISARTKAALAAARIRGVELGGQRGSLDRIAPMAQKGNAASAAVRRAAVAKRNEDLLPVIEDLRGAGYTTPQQIADGLNARDITAARGVPGQPCRCAGFSYHRTCRKPTFRELNWASRVSNVAQDGLDESGDEQTYLWKADFAFTYHGFCNVDTHSLLPDRAKVHTSIYLGP